MFQPITDFTFGKYFANEAAYAKMFTDFGMSPFPAPKNVSKPTKTWNAPPNGTFKWGNVDTPGYLVVAEGRSVSVVDQKGAGEQVTWSTAIVPPALGQLLTNFQHEFYVEYRHHEDYQQGIPCFQVDYVGAGADWLAEMNFSLASGLLRFLPPIDQSRLMNWGMRFKPGSTQKRMEDIEVFPIEQYRLKFKPPAPTAKPLGDYQYDDAGLAAQAMQIMFGANSLAAKGAAIRKLAEARK